jgi:hypothetical protein
VRRGRRRRGNTRAAVTNSPNLGRTDGAGLCGRHPASLHRPGSLDCVYAATRLLSSSSYGRKLEQCFLENIAVLGEPG